MKFYKRRTGSGFSIVYFEDDYGLEGNIQISSACEPHIWLGISSPKLRIMWKDAKVLGLNLEKKYPETNECGWCDYPIPDEVFIDSRLHLTRKQSFCLALKLLKYAFFEKL